MSKRIQFLIVGIFIVLFGACETKQQKSVEQEPNALGECLFETPDSVLIHRLNPYLDFNIRPTQSSIERGADGIVFRKWIKDPGKIRTLTDILESHCDGNSPFMNTLKCGEDNPIDFGPQGVIHLHHQGKCEAVIFGMVRGATYRNVSMPEDTTVIFWVNEVFPETHTLH